MFLTCRDDQGIVVFETNDKYMELRETDDFVSSLPRCNTIFFEGGESQIVTRLAKACTVATPVEVRKYTDLKLHWMNNHSSNLIWDSSGLMLGNYVKRSNDNYWSDAAKGQIIRITLDEFIMIDTQAPRGLFEYIDLNDDWLDQFGFFVDNSKAHIIINESGNIFQINKVPFGWKHNPMFGYEFTWGAVKIRHVHKLQNIVSELTGLDLQRKDGAR